MKTKTVLLAGAVFAAGLAAGVAGSAALTWWMLNPPPPPPSRTQP